MNVESHEQKKVGWYHTTWALIVAIVTVGPLALPLVWTHPKYGVQKKVFITVIIVLLTAATIMASVETLKWAKNYMEEIQKTIEYGQGK